MQGSVTVHMAAPPERVWELVSDATATLERIKAEVESA
jgi:uncharacterized protein YndB with AHSA1/START domain